jgi:hypothetical protein
MRQKCKLLLRSGEEALHVVFADVGSVGAVRELVRIDGDTDLGELGYDLGEGDVWW